MCEKQLEIEFPDFVENTKDLRNEGDVVDKVSGEIGGTFTNTYDDKDERIRSDTEWDPYNPYVVEGEEEK